MTDAAPNPPPLPDRQSTTTGASLDSASTGLAQRLSQRLTATPGVINTTVRHGHEIATTALTERLLQRLSLPSQTVARYQTGIVHPEVSTQLQQRFQRREGMPALDSGVLLQRFSAPGTGLETASASTRSAISPAPTLLPDPVMPAVMPAPPTITRSPLPPISQSPGAEAPAAPATFRIRRQPLPTSPAVLPLASLDGANAIGSSPATGSADSLPSATIPAAVIATPASSVSPAEPNPPEAWQILRRPLSSALPPSSIGARQASLGDALTFVQASTPTIHPSPEADAPRLRRYPLAEVTAPVAQSDSSPLMAVPLGPVVRPQIQRQPSAEIPNTRRHGETSPLFTYPLATLVQRQPSQESAIPASTALPRSRSVTPVPSTAPSTAPSTGSLPFPQAAPAAELPLIQARSLAPSLQRHLPLAEATTAAPLVLRAMPQAESIQRQITESVGEMAPTSSTSAPAPQPAAAGNALNAADMADQVSRILSRQLAVERERRGLAP